MNIQQEKEECAFVAAAFFSCSSLFLLKFITKLLQGLQRCRELKIVSLFFLGCIFSAQKCDKTECKTDRKKTELFDMPNYYLKWNFFDIWNCSHFHLNYSCCFLLSERSNANWPGCRCQWNAFNLRIPMLSHQFASWLVFMWENLPHGMDWGTKAASTAAHQSMV